MKPNHHLLDIAFAIVNESAVFAGGSMTKASLERMLFLVQNEGMRFDPPILISQTDYRLDGGFLTIPLPDEFPLVLRTSTFMTTVTEILKDGGSIPGQGISASERAMISAVRNRDGIWLSEPADLLARGYDHKGPFSLRDIYPEQRAQIDAASDPSWATAL